MKEPIIKIEFNGEKAVSGLHSTPLIIYIKNANITRAGTAPDCEIIASMLNRGYIVVSLDFQNDIESVSPKLDFFVHELREKIALGEYFQDKSVFPNGRYYNTFVVPSGHNVSLYHTFWEMDKHGPEGILESVVRSWNTDFKARKGEQTVYWRYPDGSRKPTIQDSSEQKIWLDGSGNLSENGDFLKIKHTVAYHITDCVRPDGSQFDMAQKMQLIYPVRPKNDIPVMCLSNSTEHLAKGLNIVGRPQMNGFLFKGYAGVVFDHLYQPMAYADNYGYYDGNMANGGASGDPASYSLHFFCEKKVITAAMRYIRYLSLSNHEKFRFDNEKIGVYGNSKGGWMNFLGCEEIRKPTVFDKSKFRTLEDAIDARINGYRSMRQFTGYPDVSRYQAGHTDDEITNGITVCAGELQPHLTYNGREIPSHANLIYSSCGGNTDDLTFGNAPIFISIHLADNFVTLCSMANLARIHDIPSVYFVIDRGHDFAQGKDILHGVDTYTAFMDFCDYYLKNAPVKLLYTNTNNGAMIFKFSGSVDISKILTVSVIHNETELNGKWSSSYGYTEWSFIPSTHKKGTVKFKFPADFSGTNGTSINEEICIKFTLDKLEAGTAVNKPLTDKTLYVTDFKDYLSFPNQTVACISKAPDGTDALSMYIKSGSYKNSLTNPPLFYINNFLFDLNIGDKIKLSLLFYDTKERRITVRLESATDREKRIFDLNECIYNLKTVPNGKTEITLEHRISFIPKSGIIPVTVYFEYADGDESPVWLKKIKLTK